MALPIVPPIKFNGGTDANDIRFEFTQGGVSDNFSDFYQGGPEVPDTGAAGPNRNIARAPITADNPLRFSQFLGASNIIAPTITGFTATSIIAPNTNITFTWSVTDEAYNRPGAGDYTPPYLLEISTNGGASWTTVTNAIPAPGVGSGTTTQSYTTTTPAFQTPYIYRLTASNVSGSTTATFSGNVWIAPTITSFVASRVALTATSATYNLSWSFGGGAGTSATLTPSPASGFDPLNNNSYDGIVITQGTTWTLTVSNPAGSASATQFGIPSVDIEYLIVGGGAGGYQVVSGSSEGWGGAGSGGVRQGTMSLTGTSYSITVGGGGGYSGSGGTSSAFGFTAGGGSPGGGPAFGSPMSGGTQATNGNGGGGGQGGRVTAWTGGGGGGGAGSAGSTGGYATGGAGGDAILSAITGSNVAYAGGGGGGGGGAAGAAGSVSAGGSAGGIRSGGTGGVSNPLTNSTPPVANTGGGGGSASGQAGQSGNVSGRGSTGAAGVVIIAYQGDPVYSGGTRSTTSRPGWTVHTFTTSGTLSR